MVLIQWSMDRQSFRRCQEASPMETVRRFSRQGSSTCRSRTSAAAGGREDVPSSMPITFGRSHHGDGRGILMETGDANRRADIYRYRNERRRRLACRNRLGAESAHYSKRRDIDAEAEYTLTPAAASCTSTPCFIRAKPEKESSGVDSPHKANQAPRRPA